MITQNGERRTDRFAQLEAQIRARRAPRKAKRYPEVAAPACDRFRCYPGFEGRFAVGDAWELASKVATWFRLPSANDLTLRTNVWHISQARHVAMYAIYNSVRGASLPIVGKLFGGYHHTTVLHAVRQVADDRRQVPSLDEFLRGLGL